MFPQAQGLIECYVKNHNNNNNNNNNCLFINPKESEKVSIVEVIPF